MKRLIFYTLVYLSNAYFALAFFHNGSSPSPTTTPTSGIFIPSQPVAGARGLTLAEIGGIIAIVGSFLTSIGVLFAIIAIIWSGITYMRAGDNEKKIEGAKKWFRNALLGGLIVLGVGVIINTLANVVTREFFCRLSFFGRCLF